MRSSNRATLAAVKSLKTISKVCSSDSVKNFDSPLRLLSTAAERFDHPITDGRGSGNLPADTQNPDGRWSNCQSPTDAQQKCYQGNVFGKHPVGQNVNFSGYNGQNVGYNSVGGYRESYGGEYQDRRAGGNANFAGFQEQNNGGFQQKSFGAVNGEASMGFELKFGEFQQNQSGPSPGIFANGFQQCTATGNENSTGCPGGISAGRLEKGFQHAGNRYADGYQNQNLWRVQQNMTVQSAGYVQSLENANRGSMYNPSNGYRQELNEPSPNPNSLYSQGLQSGVQGSASGYYNDQNMLNSRNFQTEWHNGQQSSGDGQYQMSAQSNSTGSQATADSQHKEESFGGSKSTGYVGSIQEFDALCGEGKVKEAVEVLKLLENNGNPIDLPRYVGLMRLCGDTKAIEEAKAVHEHLVRCTSPVSVYIYNRILVMYLKCCAVDEAFTVFDKMAERNLTTWDTMITGLTNNGLGEEAIDIFTEFKQAGLEPDGQMFSSVFSACSVTGDAHEGILHFESMAKDYGITPSMEHYVNVVDMLGRIGHLHDALDFIENMPRQPSVGVWETLMNLCRIHGERELGDRCAELVGELDPSRLNDQSRSGLVPVNTAEMAKEEEKRKAAKKNLLEARSTVHEYRAGDTSHPETDRIYAQLRGLRGLMKEAGYVPETRFVLHDIDQESKEDALLAHSERLAVSYGLLSSSARSPIRVIKNLRVCGDCHNALKIMSKLVGREFIMRDAKRFHHFKDGVCSCRDYW